MHLILQSVEETNTFNNLISKSNAYNVWCLREQVGYSTTQTDATERIITPHSWVVKNYNLDVGSVISTGGFDV